MQGCAPSIFPVQNRINSDGSCTYQDSRKSEFIPGDSTVLLVVMDAWDLNNNNNNNTPEFCAKFLSPDFPGPCGKSQHCCPCTEKLWYMKLFSDLLKRAMRHIHGRQSLGGLRHSKAGLHDLRPCTVDAAHNKNLILCYPIFTSIGSARQGNCPFRWIMTTMSIPTRTKARSLFA